jgi:hypothetical protein
MREPIPPDDQITSEMMRPCVLCGEPALRYGCESGDGPCRGFLSTRHVNHDLAALTAKEQFDAIRGELADVPRTEEEDAELMAWCEDRFARDEAWRARFGPDPGWSRRLVYDTPLRARLGQQAELARERAHPEIHPNVCGLCRNQRDRYHCEGRTCRGLLVTPSTTVPVCMLTAKEEYDLIVAAAYESDYRRFHWNAYTEATLFAACEKRFERDQAWRSLVGPDCTWTYRLENDEAFRDAFGRDDDRPQGHGR